MNRLHLFFIIALLAIAPTFASHTDSGNTVLGREMFEGSVYSRFSTFTGDSTTLSTIKKTTPQGTPLFDAATGVKIGRFEYSVPLVEETDNLLPKTTTKPRFTRIGKYVVVHLNVKNTGRLEEYLPSPRFVRLVDQHGEEHKKIGTFQVRDFFLFNKRVKVGETRTGVVVFEVPKDIEPKQLHISTGTTRGNVLLNLKSAFQQQQQELTVQCAVGSAFVQGENDGHTLALKSLAVRDFGRGRGKIDSGTFYVAGPDNTWVSYKIHFTISRHNRGLGGMSTRVIRVDKDIMPKDKCFSAEIPLRMAVTNTHHEQVIGVTLRRAGRDVIRTSKIVKFIDLAR